jgi:hypothetical protein
MLGLIRRPLTPESLTRQDHRAVPGNGAAFDRLTLIPSRRRGDRLRGLAAAALPSRDAGDRWRVRS